jgi:ankyrin repeat protein
MFQSLHACVRFNPPLHIVQVLIELLPESTSFVDCMNRTPLHIAAGTRADLSTIQLLVNASPFSCSIRDVNGMTPLHLACDSTCEIYTGDEQDCTRDPPTYDVVSMLLKIYPTAVTLEDEEGTSALEHAILSDAPINVVKLLQAITCQQNEMKAQQEMKVLSFMKSRRVSHECQSPNNPNSNHMPLCQNIHDTASLE